MADQLVSALTRTLVGTLNSIVVKEIGLACGFQDELNNLESTFGTIQLVLHDVELKKRKNEALQNWLRKLKDAAYEVENLLDDIATEGLRRRAESDQLCSFHLIPKSALFRSKIAHKMKNLRKKLDFIAKERYQFNLMEGEGVVRFGVTLESRETNSRVNDVMVFGRNKEMNMIIDEMVDSSHLQDDVSVYAIWGMGGIGKTTLTQLVYNDARMMKLFELRIWVCVSADFNIDRLVREIIESIDGYGCSVSRSDTLQRLLRDKMRGRRFLLVLDDVWNENIELWDGLKEALKCGMKGSFLIVTTRIEKIASMMATIPPYNIGRLLDNDSWSLFKYRAFTTAEVDMNLVKIGNELVRKCGGVPLAIKALGSLMRLKTRESEWLDIKESECWRLWDEEIHVLPALRLSYENLTPQMQQCFAYCCVFPKDYYMGENQLIQLWMANGFIVPSQGHNLHLVGRIIFKELVWRSFLQDVHRDPFGEVTCKMHDLMHDLALSLMRHETYILEYGKMPRFPKMIRHLGLHLDVSRAVPENKSNLQLPVNSLRSIIVHRGKHKDVTLTMTKRFLSLVSKQRYVRVLVMNSDVIKKSPDLLYKLIHLRNLTLSCRGLRKLPESVTSLHNLQTLKLICSINLLELPKQLKLLKNLWFLEMDRFGSLLRTPPDLGDLTSLCILSVFIVGQEESYRISQLKNLKLGGALAIFGLGNVRDLEEAKSANLIMKTDLSSLSLSWKSYFNENSSQRCEEVLEGILPHGNLEKLKISSYQGSKFPNWMSAFKKLKEICLEDCGRCEHLPALGELPCLIDLWLIGMRSLKCLGAEFCGNGERPFPALGCLHIHHMPNLAEWNVPDSVESFPCLTDLQVHRCPKLAKLPFLPNMRNLYFYATNVTLLGYIKLLPLEILHIRSLAIGTLPNVLYNPYILKTLILAGCSELESVAKGIQYLKSLQILQIRHCDSLTSFPAHILESLSSLRLLELAGCKKLDPLLGPLQKGIVLERLVLKSLPELKEFPESMRKLNCLRELVIDECEGLHSLPKWIGGLELRVLSISRCPNLKRRCKKPDGEDWPSISDIQCIRVDKDTVQDLDG